MLTDRYGLDLTTDSAAAAEAYVRGCDGVLAAFAGPERHLAVALGEDPDFALGHAALARARFVLGRVPEARAAAARARELAPRASAREGSHVNALALAIEGRPAEALAATREHLGRWPRDAMVLAPATGVFGLIGFSGRQGREEELLELMQGLAGAYGRDWWFESILAFAACEAGRLEEARRLIERAMAAEPRNAHGAHIRAHVLYETGEDVGALEYLSRWLPDYPREGLMHCHLSWHLALSSLAAGDAARAWQVYREQVHPGGSWGPAINTVTDAVSFLWRSELAGEARRAGLWAAALQYAEQSFPKAGIAFADVHVAAARAACGDAEGLARLATELRAREASGRAPAGPVVAQLCEGLGAFARSDWAGAIGALEAALPEAVRIGGSRAQRDLLEYTLLAAYLKAGRPGPARRLIGARQERRPSVGVAGFAA